MENIVETYTSKEFGQIRTVQLNNETYFVGKDVCKAFGDTNYRRSLANIDETDKGVSQINTPGGMQNMTLINESGLYSLLFQMQPQKAKGVSQNDDLIKERIEKLHRFKRWVTSEVLPSIRKTGKYDMSTPTTYLEALEKLVETERARLELETTVQQMDKVILEMTPKVDYVDRILASNDCMTITQIAQDYGYSAKTFNNILKSVGIQHKVGEQWVLYAEHQGKGYVRTRTHEYRKPNGESGTKPLTVWTQKGRMFLYNTLKAIGVEPDCEVSHV